MKTKLRSSKEILFIALLALGALPLAAGAATVPNVGYVHTNLVSDVPGAASHHDPQALNSWGIVAGPRTVWVNQNHAGVTSGYGPLGQTHPFVINIPGPAGSTNAGTPTGLELNGTRQFVITNGTKSAPAAFLISTEDGTIAAWEQKISGSTAVVKVDKSGDNSVYKGLAIVRDTNGAPLVFAADFHNAQIDTYDGDFHHLRSFTDTDLPAGYAPFNVKNIRGHLFVTFAKQLGPNNNDDQAGAHHGFVDIFDTDGTVLRRFASQGALNSPWGMAVAPRNFGKFSHALLVGNFGDGRINAYDLLTGKYLGTMKEANGDDLVIDGLWGLAFEKDEVPQKESFFLADRLYFTAGPSGEDHGVVGIIRPVNRLAR